MRVVKDRSAGIERERSTGREWCIQFDNGDYYRNKKGAIVRFKYERTAIFKMWELMKP